MRQDELENLIQYLVNRVKDLKADIGKSENRITEIHEWIKTLSDASRDIIEHQERLESRLRKLEIGKDRENAE